MAQNLENIFQDHLLRATKMVEDQVDAELHRLETLDEDELETIRAKRLEQMKKLNAQKQEWFSQGHGSYSEVADEKEFFQATKKSFRLICHFYRDSTFRCKIVDKHLAELAPKHVETRFIKINVEKAHFLVERLKVKMLPTIVLIKDGKTVDRIIGFDELGGTDEFSNEMMEWRIARAEVINYSGNIYEPPTTDSKKSIHFAVNKTIRSQEDDFSDDD
ncbi:Thioredoxin domain-containing protein 9 [Trichoplax sp. H2]|uniref:Thioredoxin domain-containing protein 9 n=1 Tax=Trichoplax adhaerens TaxID=10228 RepID=B3RW97_TRIAD|nr:hypothetical protein TRIADDRAFT_56672 [Trichoplax adhaerens]EDV24653.1 hypothetical protein TRIADDRAFT_56672 [Trichoplax adhaerens]RDD38240.1 Thioredoxin domain-containing protein 9 [Trichoplax sp. H2]|eukprot:XP_002112543.1 hypothetical protein TRIADDRAFT_56672 [Trichoplax adhaerens]